MFGRASKLSINLSPGMIINQDVVKLSPGESTELVQTPGDEEAVLVQHLPGNKVGKRQTLPGKPCATNILKIAEILLMIINAGLSLQLLTFPASEESGTAAAHKASWRRSPWPRPSH